EKLIPAIHGVSRETDNSSGAFTKAGASIITFNQALELAGKAARALGVAFDVLSLGVQRGATFDDLSAQLGVTVEELSRVELVLNTSGVSMEQYGVGIRQLSKNLFDFQRDTGEARVALEALGFDKAAL